MLWAKLAVPLVMVVGGAGALVVASDDSSTVTTGAAQVWIDAPTGESPFGPGTVTVAAHGGIIRAPPQPAPSRFHERS